MKPGFEIGDRVHHIDSDYHGVIVGKWQENGYTVRYDEDDSDEYYVLGDDIEFENPKLAFLTRLQELLATFDAKISGGGYDGYGDYLSCTIGTANRFELGEYSEYGDRPTVTADNIFSYDKD